MSLLSTWSDANKETQTALKVRYVWLPANSYSNQVSGEVTQWFEYHRYATKQYRYVGMTEAAARQCMAAKVAQYTHDKLAWEWRMARTDEELEQYGPACNWIPKTVSNTCEADIEAVHVSGHMWEVTIAVNEDDIAYADSASDDPEELFADLERTYDEPGEVQDGE